MAILICRTRSRQYDIVNTEKITRITEVEFKNSGFYKVCIYPNEFEVVPIEVPLKDMDNVKALLTVLQADGYFIIEDGEIKVWKGQDLFTKAGQENDHEQEVH